MLFRLPGELRFLAMYDVLLPSKRGRRALVAPGVSRKIGERHPLHPPRTGCRDGKQALVLDRAVQRRKMPLPHRTQNDRCSERQGFRKCTFGEQCVQRNSGELDSSNSTAALHSAVSGIITPATDFKRAKAIGLILE